MANPITLNAHTSGDTWRGLALTLSVNGSPMDLTGATVRMQMRKDPAAAAVEQSWSSTDGSIVIDNPLLGALTVGKRVISGSGKLYFDVQVTDAAGDVRTVVSGILPLVQDVTRD